MTVIPISKQKCLNMSKKHDSPAYYCDECLNDIRKETMEKFAEELKGEFEWTNVKDDSGGWSPGIVAIKIDKFLQEKFKLFV